jgi:hypothetical protein
MSEANASVTIAVETPQPSISACYAIPTNINPGEASTIYYTAANATGISVNPSVPGVSVGGSSFVVTPQTSTTYTITVTGPAGTSSSSCAVNVTVGPGGGGVTPPRIVRFTASPTQIVMGEASTLVWQVENADTVTITGLSGNLPLSGQQDVHPTQDTTYTLTATKNGQTATATATVSVTAGAKITSFTANPPTSPAPGSAVVLTCTAQNATSVSIAGAGPLVNGTVTVTPTVDTTYTCTAIGTRSQDQKTLTVKVTPNDPCKGPNPPPSCTPNTGIPPTVVIAGGPVMETLVRTVTLDASQSVSPSGYTPLKYLWTAREGRAAIANSTSATPIVYLGNLYGDYFFDVTVTDSRGNVSTGTIDIRLVVTRIP